MIDDKITEAMPNLTKKQAMLGRYICENKYAVALMNAPMIAKEAGVSEATLTRFVYSLGYSSFSEFLLDLRRDAGGERQQPLPPGTVRAQGQACL